MYLRLLLFVSLLIPGIAFGQLTDAQLSTQLQDLIPNNSSNLITPASVRKVIQDGYDARISVYGNLGIKGLLGYNTLPTLTNDKQLVHKKYVDDKFAAIINSVQTFNGRDGTVVPLAGDYTFSMIGSKPTTINGYGIIPSFSDYAAFYYPLTGNPSGFITLSEARNGFSAPDPFFNYNAATGRLGISYTPLNSTLPDGQIYIGSSSDLATARTPSGDIQLSNTGVFTLPPINSNVGEFNNITLNAKGQGISARNISYILLADKNTTGNMGNSNVQVPTEFTIRNWVNSLGFYSGSAPVTNETDPQFTANGVFKNGSYPDPSFVQSLSKTKIIGLVDPVQSDWNETNTAALDYIKNKPSVPSAQVSSDWNSTSGVTRILNKPILSTVATTGSYLDLLNKPVIPSTQIQSDWLQTNTSAFDYIKNKPSIPASQVPADWNSSSGVSQILNKPTISTAGRTGDYNDLLNKPTIPASQVNSDWNSTSGTSQILNKPIIPAAQQPSDWNATSGVTRILNKPSIPAAQVNADWNSSGGLSQILNKPNLSLYELIANKNTSSYLKNSTTSYPSDFTVKHKTDSLGTAITTGLSTKQNSLGFTPENISNKKTDLASPSNTTYPSTKAVSDAIAAVAAGAPSLTTANPIGYTGGKLYLKGIAGLGGMAHKYMRVKADTSGLELVDIPVTDTLVVSLPLYFTQGTPTILIDGLGNVLVTSTGDTLFAENSSTGRHLGLRQITSNEILDGGVHGVDLENVTTPGNYNNGNYDAHGRLISGQLIDYLTGITDTDVKNHLPVKDPLVYEISQAFVNDAGQPFVNDAGHPFFSGNGNNGLSVKPSGIPAGTYNYVQSIKVNQWGIVEKIDTGTAPTGGTLTNFSSGNLTGLFNTNVNTASSTPDQTFSFVSQLPNLPFMSPTSGSGTPSFRNFVTADFPNGIITNAKLQYPGFTLGIGTSGNSPSWSLTTPQLGNSLALRIPYAHDASVLGGLVSNAELTLAFAGSRVGTFSNSASVRGMTIAGDSVYGNAASSSTPGFLGLGTQVFPSGDKGMAQNGADPTSETVGNTSYEFKFPSSYYTGQYGLLRNDWTIRSGTGSAYAYSHVLDFRLNGSSVMQIRNGNSLVIGGGGTSSSVVASTHFGDNLLGQGNDLVISGGSTNGRDFVIKDRAGTFSQNAVSVSGSLYSGAPTITVDSPNADNDLQLQGKGAGNVLMGSPVVLPQFTSSTRPSVPPTATTIFCTNCTATDGSTGVMQIYNGSTWKNAW